MSDDLILRIVSKFLIPVIVLFGLYVQFHGEYGPGGGFQAGVILASALILYLLVFGSAAVRAVVPLAWLRWQAAFGVALYAGTGMATLLLGGEFLEYGVLAADPVAGQHLGIILIELGVMLTVSSTIALLAMLFAGEPDES
jgi:multicomponent Na+:H+ antiporter subunit B